MAVNNCRHRFNFALSTTFSSRLNTGNQYSAVYCLCYREQVANAASTFTPSDSNLFATFWIPYSGATMMFYGASPSYVYRYYFQFRRPGVNLTDKYYTTTSGGSVDNQFNVTNITGTFADGKKYFAMKEFEHVENPHYDTLQYTTPLIKETSVFYGISFQYGTIVDPDLSYIQYYLIDNNGGIGVGTGGSLGMLLWQESLTKDQCTSYIEGHEGQSLNVYAWHELDGPTNIRDAVLQGVAVNIGTMGIVDPGTAMNVTLNSAGMSFQPGDVTYIGFYKQESIEHVEGVSPTYDFSDSELVDYTTAPYDTGWLTGGGDNAHHYMTCAQFSASTPNVKIRRSLSPYICETEKVDISRATNDSGISVYFSVPHQVSRTDTYAKTLTPSFVVPKNLNASYRNQVLIQLKNGFDGPVISERIYNLSGFTKNTTTDRTFNPTSMGYSTWYIPKANSAQTLYIDAYVRTMTGSTSNWTPWGDASATTSINSATTTMKVYLGSASTWNGSITINTNVTGGAIVSEMGHKITTTLQNKNALTESGLTFNTSAQTTNLTNTGVTSRTFTFVVPSDVTAFTPSFTVSPSFANNVSTGATLAKTSTSKTVTVPFTSPSTYNQKVNLTIIPDFVASSSRIEVEMTIQFKYGSNIVSSTMVPFEIPLGSAAPINKSYTQTFNASYYGKTATVNVSSITVVSPTGTILQVASVSPASVTINENALNISIYINQGN